jgi:cysteine-S-conjugate beta-lyase
MADIEHAASFTVAELRGRRGVKWHRHPGDVLPCWVAEMDFPVAPSIQAAMQRLVQSQEYGYPLRDGERAEVMVCRAFARRMHDRFGWQVDPNDAFACADLVQTSFASVLAFSEPGDQVVLQTPAYPPFREAILSTGRRLLAAPMRDDGSRYVFDIDRLANDIDPRTRIILFCHPHNPTGRVLGRDELEALGALAIKHDLVIVSDEIHADLVYSGRHIPLASVSPAIAARTITMTSATKSFNIPGLRCGVIHFGSSVLKARFEARVPQRLLGAPSIAGIDATVAAWDAGQPWLDATLARLEARNAQLAASLRRELPQMRFYPPEATYLAWIDCSALRLGMPAAEFFLEKAGVAASPGENFDAPCSDFLRLNFATSAAILDEIVTRMVRAVHVNSRAA